MTEPQPFKWRHFESAIICPIPGLMDRYLREKFLKYLSIKPGIGQCVNAF
jgi:hypothetical protein